MAEYAFTEYPKRVYLPDGISVVVDSAEEEKKIVGAKGEIAKEGAEMPPPIANGTVAWADRKKPK